MNKIIIGLVIGYIAGFLMAFYVTNDKMAREQARANNLEIQLYNEQHKEPVISERRKAEIKCEGMGKFFAECVEWELKNK